MRITSGSKLSGLVVTQISRNVLSSSAMLYLKMEWAAFSCSRKQTKVLRAGPAGATPRWMRSRVYMLLSVMTAATRRWLPAGMAVMKATESFSSWVSLRWKKFRSLSFMYFSKMSAFTFLPGLKLITFAMAPPVRDFIFHSLYYGCT